MIIMISLKPIFENELESVVKLDIHIETIDSAYDKYNNAVLDIFDHQLSVEEADMSIGSFVDHNLKYEHRYLQFIEDIYKANDYETIIIEVNLSDLENLDILRILDSLDYKDKLLFIDIIRFNENKSNIFSIDNMDILYLFIKLSTRELIFSVFHFTKIQITIVGGWDLSFSVFYNNENDFNEYLSIARKNELFFRDIETIS